MGAKPPGRRQPPRQGATPGGRCQCRRGGHGRARALSRQRRVAHAPSESAVVPRGAGSFRVRREIAWRGAPVRTRTCGGAEALEPREVRCGTVWRLAVAAPLGVIAGLCLWLAVPRPQPLAARAGRRRAARPGRPRPRGRAGCCSASSAASAFLALLLHWSGSRRHRCLDGALVLEALFYRALGWACRRRLAARLAPVASPPVGRPGGGARRRRTAASPGPGSPSHQSTRRLAPGRAGRRAGVTFAVALAGALLAWAVLNGPRVSSLAVVAGRSRRWSVARLRPARWSVPTGGRATSRSPASRATSPGGLDFAERRAGARQARQGHHRAGRRRSRPATRAAAGHRDLAGELHRPRPLPATRRPPTIDAAVRRPTASRLLVGAVLRRPGQDDCSNVGIVWDPGDRARRSSTSSGTRCRSASTSRCGRFFRHFSAVDLVPRDFVRGHQGRPAQLGPAKVGVAICFEVAYDSLVRDRASTGGADLLVVQTNNATFGHRRGRPAAGDVAAAGGRARPVRRGRLHRRRSAR